ncbi:MAG: hypothetical protein ABI723_13005 [Bacteroidia bacterium]
MDKSYYIKDDNKSQKTLKELKRWYLDKIAEQKKIHKNFSELPFLEEERKHVLEILNSLKPVDNENEILINKLYFYIGSFLNLRLLPLLEKPDSAEEQFLSLEKWFEKCIAQIKDPGLQKKWIENELQRTKRISLDRIDIADDLKDNYFKEEFEAGQKFLTFLRDKLETISTETFLPWNPTNHFEELKKHRLQYFKKRKQELINERNDLELEINEDDLRMCYLFWLQDEIKTIDVWMSDTLPNGKKSIKKTDSNKIELFKYQRFVLSQIEKHKLESKPRSESQDLKGKGNPKNKDCPPSFTITPGYLPDLKNVHENLVDNKMLPKKTYALLLKIFSGEVISRKVKWTGDNEELHYFIQMLKKHSIIDKHSKPIWKITALCFIDKYGNEYTQSQLQKTLNPSNNIKIKSALKKFNFLGHVLDK